jgi:hypothetical protein
MRKATGLAGAIAAGAILTSAALAAAVNPFQFASLSQTTPTQSAQINRTSKTDSLPTVAYARSQVQTIPAESVRPVLSPTSPGDGCEAAVAQHTGPADIARVPSRCITQLPTNSNVAALN